jgi:hypothetical protein
MRNAAWVGSLALVLLVACSSSSNAPARNSPSPSVVADVGDACLVGNWVLKSESGSLNSAGVSYKVSGLGGAKLSIGAQGLETIDYTGSEALVVSGGTVTLSSLYTGSLMRQIHASAGVITASATTGNASVTNTVNGVKSSAPVHLGAATLNYTCTDQELVWKDDSMGVSTVETFARV